MYRNLNFDTHEHHVNRSSEIRMKKRVGSELYGGNHNHGGHRNMGGNHNHGGHRNMGGYHEHFENCNQSSMGCGGKHDQGGHKNMNSCDQGHNGNAMGCGGKHNQGAHEPYAYSASYNTYSKPI